MPANTQSAGRRQYWITVLCFAMLNVGAWLASDRHLRTEQHGLLRVEAFEPGDNAITGPRPTLRWRFNTDVIPTAAYGRDPGTVRPAVAGHWGWDNPRTLVFTPDADLPRATRVTFTLADTFLRSSSGATLPRQYATSIRSVPLVVESVRQTANLMHDQFLIELRFNDRVAPAELLQKLKITDSQGKLIRCRLFGEPREKTVRLQTDPIPNPHSDASDGAEQLGITLAPGLTGLSGTLGLADGYSTTIAINRALAAIELRAEAPLSGQPALHLSFNDHVILSALQQIVSVEPKVDFTLQSDSDSDVSLVGDFHPRTRYTVRFASAPPGTDPANYPLAGHFSAFMPDRQSGVWFDNDQGYLSSAGNRTLLAHTVNIDAVRIAITRVYDSNLVAWRNGAGRGYDWSRIDGYAKPLAEKTITLPPEKNVAHDIQIALDDFPPGTPRAGVYRVAVRPVDAPAESAENEEDDDSASVGASAVATLSDIGLTAKETRTGLVAWATSVRTAAPLAGVRVRIFSSKNQPLGEAITDSAGLARIDGIQPAKDEAIAVILADRLDPASPIGPTTVPAADSSDLTWLDVRRTAWDLGDLPVGGRSYVRSGYDAFLFTDRGVYRPGEVVRLRAIVRGTDHRAPGASFPVRWQVRQPDGRNWQNKVVMLDTDGAASFDVQLLPDLPTGQWSASLDLPGSTITDGKPFGSATFSVEEFVPSRMKVSLAFADSGGNARHSLADGPIQAQVQADYLFGRPAANLTTELSTRFEPVAFAPVGWSGWAFGDTALARTSGELHPTNKKWLHAQPTNIVEVALDPAGHYHWSIDAAGALGAANSVFSSSEDYAGPWRLLASSSVQETGGRAVTATQHLDIDALPAYLGVRRNNAGDAKPGAACPMQVRLVRPDGHQAGGDATVEAALFRVIWNTSLTCRAGRYCFDSTRVLEPVEKSSAQLSGGAGQWSPTVPSSGDYLAEFRNPATGAFTSLEFFATGESPWDDNISRENPEHLDVRLLPSNAANDPGSTDARTPQFAVGQTARVAVGSPFPGRLLLTVETDEVKSTRVIDMKSTHIVVSVPVTEACRPNAFVTATVIRAVDPNAKWQAHRAFGIARLRVDPADQTLHVAVTPPGEMRPMQSMDVGIAVTDNHDMPVANAAVAVAAVDEGICQLTDFATPDPTAFFNSDRALAVRSSDLFDLLMPEVARPDGIRAVGGDEPTASLSRHITPVVARRFVPVVLAWVTVHTDSMGLARASFSVPEFQGRLRVMAVAYDASAAGAGDAPVTVRSPILAQSTWPRFAAPGDQFSVPVLLFNNTNSAGSAKVAAELENGPDTSRDLLSFDLDHHQRVELPPIDMSPSSQRQVSLPVFIGQAVGVAKLHLHVAMNGESFDEHVELPIRPAAPRMQFGGAMAASPLHPARIPLLAGMLPGTDTLSIHVTAWPTLHLPEALDYLDHYPFGCVEQTTSGCFPLLALHEIGKQLDPARFDPKLIQVKVDAGITQLLGMQTTDGGLAMWPGQEEAWAWGSIYAAHFLVEARAAGFAVPDDLYRPLLAYVRRQLDEVTDDSSALERQAYAEYVLCLAGTPDRASLSRLAELARAPVSVDESSPDDVCMRSDSQLFLACAWALAGRDDLAEGMIPQTLPPPRNHRQTDENIGSPIRDEALVIYTLAIVHPADPRLASLVQQLADSAQHQEWDTQECAFAALAIGKYLERSPGIGAFDSAKLFAGDAQLAGTAAGGSIDWTQRKPSADLANRFAVKISGPADAQAYVSWMQSGVPMAPPADADHGIRIRRRYLTVSGRPINGNTVETGELVRVQLTLDASAGATNLAVEDMLPAGLEAENGALKTSAAQADSPQAAGNSEDDDDDDDANQALPRRARMDVRDDRVIITGNMPSAGGPVTLEYLARAVTPGIYVLPPVRAEAMYNLAENGLSGAGGKFIVRQPGPNIANIRE